MQKENGTGGQKMTDRDRLAVKICNATQKTNFACKEAKCVGKGLCAYCYTMADDLLANGAILPPCKVGDKVYDICTIFDESTLKPKTIIKPRIIDFVSKVGFIIESKGLVIGEKDFGNKIFLTKEEAEKALAERNGNNG